MMWQDIVIMVANIIFSYALIPQIYSGFKTKKGLIEMQTSTIMALGLYAVAIAFLSLDLYFSAIMVSVSGTLWVILLIQKIKYQ